jgi:hypothetical protein
MCPQSNRSSLSTDWLQLGVHGEIWRDSGTFYVAQTRAISLDLTGKHPPGRFRGVFCCPIERVLTPVLKGMFSETFPAFMRNHPFYLIICSF